jgi:hypothetical protein
MSKYKKKANTITIEQAEEDYKELIEEAHDKKMWLKAKGLNLWVSPYELKLAWQMGKYLFPANYWELGKPHNYLKPYAEKKRKADNMYEYAHKRYVAYVQMLDQNKHNI